MASNLYPNPPAREVTQTQTAPAQQLPNTGSQGLSEAAIGGSLLILGTLFVIAAAKPWRRADR